MKIVILEDFYEGFLKFVYSNDANLFTMSFKEQQNKIQSEFFGIGGRYFDNMRKIPEIDTNFFVSNNKFEQFKWMKEKGKGIRWDITNYSPVAPIGRGGIWSNHWLFSIAIEQIRSIKPDVVLVHMSGAFPQHFLKRIKPYTKLLVGQIASPLPDESVLKEFDLFISSLPNLVDDVKKIGINSELLPLAFESNILKTIKNVKKKYGVTFVGGIALVHIKSIELLEELSKKVPLKIFGYGRENIPRNYNLYKCHGGEVWGKEMFKILAESKITINRHSSVSGIHANNMRMYEATGMGAMLITDKKIDNNKYFKIGKEIEEYIDANDLIGKVQYFLDNDNVRKKIALAGQAKTIESHNYGVRTRQLLDIFEKYLNKNE